MRHLLFVVLLLLLPSSLVAQEPSGAAASAPLVRIVTTRFVLPGKFRPMKEWAHEAGVRLDWRYVDEAEDRQGLADGAALLVLDGPRPGDMAQVKAALGSLDALSMPWIAVGGGPPAFGNLSPAQARRLIAYYAGGGETNLRLFVAAAARIVAGGELNDLPPAQAIAQAGFYHPDAPAPFASAQAYRHWIAAQGWQDRPLAAVAISDGVLRDMQTQVVDALARSMADHGLMPAFFWYDRSDAQAITQMVAPLAPVALVNFTHMQDGDARKAEFEALDIPVLQALGERGATLAQWREGTSGADGMSSAVMITVPETWGVSDPVVVSVVEDGEPVPIPEQLDLLSGKIARLAALRRKAPEDKALALFFWNYPQGESGLAASNLNLPDSLARLSGDLLTAGYDVTPVTGQQIIADGQAMLGGFYRPETLPELARRGLAATLPLAVYKAWFATLPPLRQAEMLASWGMPDEAAGLVDGNFLIPRLQLGKLAILPQPPRATGRAGSYHDKALPPDHRYMATYLWVRERQRADAIIHMGTHGTQEWTPGKDRGLWAGDYPFLLLGDVPVFYPYIQDNVAEAVQARRRGRAVTVSHQTPAFAPSGLYDELRDIHALIHEYAQLEAGPVRDNVATSILAAASAAHLNADMDWSDAAIAQDFEGYYAQLHDHLHQLARSSVPLGLHTFGEPARADRRLTTVMQQLGADYLAALGRDPQEAFAESFDAIRQSEPYRVLHRYLHEGEDIGAIADPALREQIELARTYDRNLATPGETEALLAGLAGRFVRAGAGGDPVRTPEVASGRNLYAFEAYKVPAQAAYEEGGRALDDLIAAYKVKHDGALPEKLAFSVFSGETIRTLGIGEGQILHALGLRPVWDRGGRVTQLEIVPLAELGRPRIDVVMQPTSVYRDQFDVFLRLLAEGIDRIADLGEDSGPAAGSRTLERALLERGYDASQARALSRLRIFTNAPGDYGSGLPDAIGRGSAEPQMGWRDEADLAEPWLARMQYAYGARDWGLKLDDVNLFAEQLRDVDAAVMSRSSNLHGLISTDHPFEYLGGISLAVRHLTGRSPDLFVTDMRGGEARMASAGQFLSDELRVRYLNPHWIGEMQQEGYAGANAMLGVVNNLWGWQVADPGSVRADQWQAMHDTYVRDVRGLGLNRFFESLHPDAQLQIVERMQEAIARDYWQADEATRRSLAERLTQLQAVIAADEAAGQGAESRGFGLAGTAPSAARAGAFAQPAAVAPPPPAEPATAPAMGRIMQRQDLTQAVPERLASARMPALLALLLFFVLGVLLQLRERHAASLRKFADARA
ncbi:cobaltochelatase subunit CobN [Aurantiacibacter xanthus]|uniref:Cobaltochelatase subunit CobN n=1 Tax=Aurantiacibacter xanthus TaxID=1784712 RepID=A0A3A1NYA8_9SPHN|nr:cobaltochelatase subunit CobN [Aurantiacibacter xanthus]RIV80118.1 cobaltochelatase subunit CobN [Aurantiacibacter xanthus]